MLETWVLVVAVGLPTVAIPGYESREACAAAGAVYQEAVDDRTVTRGDLQLRFQFYCIPGPRKEHRPG
jgi:hypothetical protein